MAEKVIGILGGMGPEATLDCFEKIIKNTPAGKDQDHLRVIIDSNPKIPDRTAAILGKGPSPLPLLIDGCRSLQHAGADFIIIPCISAHFFQEELRQNITLPLVSVFDVVAAEISNDHNEIKKVGLLGTTGTIQGGLFQKKLKEEGIETVLCDSRIQKIVMAAIYDIKKSPANRSRKAITANLASAAQALVDSGAQGIIAGCTEIPLALNSTDVTVPYFDSLLILARAAIRKAGVEPIPIAK
ncbi:MAG: amino acid racemase [Proteobacteria bacterium]|nr:amino acid racemase [Pseudomonadota bacterium]